MSNTNGFVNLPEGIYLNVRQEPNFYSNVLTSFAPKTELTILEQNGEWYQIEYQNESAYVFAQAVSTNSKIKIGGMTLNLGLLKGCGKECKMEQPIFNWNALVISKENILIKDENGDILSGSYTSNGDHITIMKNNAEKGLIFIQYPNQSENCYEQGWIDSKYISSKYLKFRFDEAWINNQDNQKIYLFNDTISQAILEKGAKYTLLYTVSNYNIQYSCILFEDNDSLEVGFVPFSTGSLGFIVDDYPYDIANECAIETFEPTVPFNATVTSDIKLIDVNGIEPNYQIVGNKTICPTIAANSRITVLEIFNSTEKSSMLIEYYDEGSNKYKKGYLLLTSLSKQVILDKNNVVWNDGVENIKVVNLTNSEVIAIIQVATEVNCLYVTNEYACVYFENQTGYVLLKNISPEYLAGYKFESKLNGLGNQVSTIISNVKLKSSQLGLRLATLQKAENMLDESIEKLKASITSDEQDEVVIDKKLSKLKVKSGLIGGINLIDGSATNFGVEGLSSNAYGFGSGAVTLGAGRTYTLTVCGENLQEALDNGQHLVFEIFNSDWSSWARLDFKDISKTVKQAIITVPKTETYWTNGYSYPYKPNAKNVKLYWYNVQEGEVGTEWVPSIYDLQNILTENKEQ